VIFKYIGLTMAVAVIAWAVYVNVRDLFKGKW
jgi:hypothetical protein